MTRDEVLAKIKEDVEAAIPENIEVDGDDLDQIETVVEQALETCCTTIDEAEDEGDDEDVDDPDEAKVEKVQ